MSIKQAIEALEELVEYAETAGFDWSLDNARAAIAALRSMPAEPVAAEPVLLSDAEIDAITVAQWGDRVLLAAYRAYARAILGRASRGAK